MQIQLLTIKPALLYYTENKNGSVLDFTMHPETMSDFNWHPREVLKAQECPAHQQWPEFGCCGIHTTLDIGFTTRRWLNATMPDYPLVFTLVQTMGNVNINDDNWDVRSEGMYLWGLLRPRWMKEETFSSLTHRIVANSGAFPEPYYTYSKFGETLQENNKTFFSTSERREKIFKKWVLSSYLSMRKELSTYYAENQSTQ